MQRFLEAVRMMDTAKDPALLRKATRFLTDFSFTVESWQVSDAVLRTTGLPVNAYFQAARMLKQKLQDEFCDLPATSHDSLRQSLMENLLRFRSGPANVRTQLCLAISTLAVQMERWSSVVQSLVQCFDASPESAQSLLVLLTVLPEEADSKQIKVSHARRRAFRDELRACTPSTLSVLHDVLIRLGSSNEAVLSQLLTAFGSWVRLGGMSSEAIASHPLFAATLQVRPTNPWQPRPGSSDARHRCPLSHRCPPAPSASPTPRC